MLSCYLTTVDAITLSDRRGKYIFSFILFCRVAILKLSLAPFTVTFFNLSPKQAVFFFLDKLKFRKGKCCFLAIQPVGISCTFIFNHRWPIHRKRCLLKKQNKFRGCLDKQKRQIEIDI